MLKAIYRALIRGLEEKVNGDGDALVDLEDAVELVEDDAEAVLGTKRSPFALEAYRKALLIGDQRWTSTVASIYLLATIGDTDSAEAIERIGSGTKLTPVRNAFKDVVPLLSG